MKAKVLEAIRTLTGLLLSLAAALVAAGIFSHSHLRLFVPLGFAVILIVLGARFGLMVSLLGSVLAAIVFAYRLFPPLGSVRVEQANARESLAWMILASVAFSYLLFPPKTRSR